ncbi:MAG: PEP-CTERM sorting domain-containing protein [Phycisphaerae bacterium]|jgi:hypothetical protein|nr:PEP-CTERM sorting domain-containing protein [Phycisphaerae bacterium]
MSCNLRNIVVAVLVVSVFSSGSILYGADLNPLHGRNSTNIFPGGGPVDDGPAFGENPSLRDLRTDFVKTWYIFTDEEHNGILDPGDKRVAQFENWWTPVSAATQHAYEIGAPPASGPDYPSTPIDHQANNSLNTTLGLPQKAGTIGFYMTYSHLDNADYDREFYEAGPFGTGADHGPINQRERERNGYAMGWLTGETVVNGAREVVYGNKTGNVKMDIFVHNGKSDNNDTGTGRDDNVDFGENTRVDDLGVVTNGPDRWYDSTPWNGPGAPAITAGGSYSTISQSDPQVAQSNDMNLLARQDNNLMLAPDYLDDFEITDPTSVAGYTYGATDGYQFAGFNGGKYRVDDDLSAATSSVLATEPDFDTVVASMDVREVNAYETAGAGTDLNGIAPIHADYRPQRLLEKGVKDGMGTNLYFYEDAFLQRDGAGGDMTKGAEWVEGSTDGGVIAGLSGYDGYRQFYDGEPGDNGPIRDPNDPLLKHWAEQQVIRIDFDKASLDREALVGISEIIFYDWGFPDPVTGQQTNPVSIVINVDDNQNIYFETGLTPGPSLDDIYFPDNRIYIAQVEMPIIPEPATMTMLLLGGSALIARRRRGRK